MAIDVGEHLKKIAEQERGKLEVVNNQPYYLFQDATKDAQGIISKTHRYGKNSLIVASAAPVENRPNHFIVSLTIHGQTQEAPTRENPSPPGSVGQNLMAKAETFAGDFYASFPDIKEDPFRNVTFDLWQLVEDDSSKNKLRERSKKVKGNSLVIEEVDLPHTQFTIT